MKIYKKKKETTPFQTLDDGHDGGTAGRLQAGDAAGPRSSLQRSLATQTSFREAPPFHASLWPGSRAGQPQRLLQEFGSSRAFLQTGARRWVGACHFIFFFFFNPLLFLLHPPGQPHPVWAAAGVRLSSPRQSALPGATFCCSIQAPGSRRLGAARCLRVLYSGASHANQG